MPQPNTLYLGRASVSLADDGTISAQGLDTASGPQAFVVRVDGDGTSYARLGSIDERGAEPVDETAVLAALRARQIPITQLVRAVIAVLAVTAAVNVIAYLLSGSGAPWLAFHRVTVAVGLAGAVVAAIWGRLRDLEHAGGVILLYQLSERRAEAILALTKALKDLARSPAHYLIIPEPYAPIPSFFVRLNGLLRILPDIGQGAPPRIVTNFPVPRLRIGGRQFHFFPDRMLVVQGTPTGEALSAIAYSDLVLTSGMVRIKTSISEARGHHVLQSTWRHARLDGGPDLRYRDNPREVIIRADRLSLKVGTYEAHMVHFALDAGPPIIDALGRLRINAAPPA